MRSKTLRIFNKALIVGIVVSVVSFFFRITPCTKLADAGNSSKAAIGLCDLPSPFESLPTITSKYYNISNNPITGLILQFLIPAAIFILIFLLVRRKTGKVLDLTYAKK